METKVFGKKEIESLRLGAIAEKHNCSSVYVRQVLTDPSKRNTALTHKIVTDASDIIGILERDTKVTL